MQTITAPSLTVNETTSTSVLVATYGLRQASNGQCYALIAGSLRWSKSEACYVPTISEMPISRPSAVALVNQAIAQNLITTAERNEAERTASMDWTMMLALA